MQLSDFDHGVFLPIRWCSGDLPQWCVGDHLCSQPGHSLEPEECLGCVQAVGLPATQPCESTTAVFSVMEQRPGYRTVPSPLTPPAVTTCRVLRWCAKTLVCTYVSGCGWEIFLKTGFF